MAIKLEQSLAELRASALDRVDLIADRRADDAIAERNRQERIMQAIILILDGRTTGPAMANIRADMESILTIRTAAADAKQAIRSAQSAGEIHAALAAFRAAITAP